MSLSDVPCAACGARSYDVELRWCKACRLGPPFWQVRWQTWENKHDFRSFEDEQEARAYARDTRRIDPFVQFYRFFPVPLE